MPDLGDSEPTRVAPTVATGPVPPTVPPPGRRGGAGGPDRRWWWAAGLAAVIVVLAIVLLIASGDDDDDRVVAQSSTTTTTTVSTTTSSTSTTLAATSTTIAATSSTVGSTTSATTPPTVAPALCEGEDADDPDTPAQVVYLAYTLGDRACADRLMTDSAADELFAIPGRGAGWEFMGCTFQELPEPPHTDCAYRFEGGATHFRMAHTPLEGWQVFDVYQTTD